MMGKGVKLALNTLGPLTGILAVNLKIVAFMTMNIWPMMVPAKIVLEDTLGITTTKRLASLFTITTMESGVLNQNKFTLQTDWNAGRAFLIHELKISIQDVLLTPADLMRSLLGKELVHHVVMTKSLMDQRESV